MTGLELAAAIGTYVGTAAAAAWAATSRERKRSARESGTGGGGTVVTAGWVRRIEERMREEHQEMREAIQLHGYRIEALERDTAGIRDAMDAGLGELKETLKGVVEQIVDIRIALGVAERRSGADRRGGG
jgi:hypothetical protein